MPKDFLALDTGFPSFTGRETVGQKVDQLYNYTYMLLENLRYCLRNLGPENFNGKALGDLTEPIYARIRDGEGRTAQLELTAQALEVRLGDAEGNVSRLQQTAAELTSQVTSARGDISTLQQTATALTSRVQSAEGNISTLQQTANGLTVRVQNAEGSLSQVQQTASSLTTTVANVQGQVSQVQQTVAGVTITTPYGQTLLNGGMIATDTLVVRDLYGQTVNLRNNAGAVMGQISITGAVTAQAAIDIYSYGALRMTAGSGSAYLAGWGAFLDVGGTISCGGDIHPSSSAYSCGTPGIPWAAVYASTGTVSTSDREKKEDIRYDVERYDRFFDLLRPASGKYRDGTSGRTHLYLVAQDVLEALEGAGLGTEDFGGLVIAPRKDGGADWSLRYQEFQPLVIWELQRLKERVGALERRQI